MTATADREAIPSARSPKSAALSGDTGPRNLYIGCAGWSVSGNPPGDFPADGSHLERYAAVFRSVEINSSFHRPHRRSTYAKWAASVPDYFRFSVKLPKTITHTKRLAGADDSLSVFLDEVGGLGEKLGALLVQLPPSAEFDAAIAGQFFESVRSRHSGDVFIEPRHKTWFGQVANKVLAELRIGRVGADPPIIPVAAEPGGISGRVYFRLHGSPQLYYSSYTTSYLDALAFRLVSHARSGGIVWCMFDNTIRGAAAVNALYLAKKVALSDRPAVRR
jgi:uncharacterized protein YecE (DUF72 family)